MSLLALLSAPGVAFQYLAGVLGLLATVALSSAGSFGFATIGMFLFMLLWFLSVAIVWLRTGEPA